MIAWIVSWYFGTLLCSAIESAGPNKWFTSVILPCIFCCLVRILFFGSTSGLCHHYGYVGLAKLKAIDIKAVIISQFGVTNTVNYSATYIPIIRLIPEINNTNRLIPINSSALWVRRSQIRKLKCPFLSVPGLGQLALHSFASPGWSTARKLTLSSAGFDLCRSFAGISIS